MPNVRLMPPNGVATTTAVNGRTYTCAANAVIDVPDFDAYVLQANGWVSQVAGAVAATVGATAVRPTNPAKNQTFHDTTLNVTIVFDGRVWRNPITGASV